MKIMLIALLLWGFLVGFIGWSSFLKLISPITNWLLDNRKGNSIMRSIAQIIVLLFLTNTFLLLLAIVPLFLIISGQFGQNEWKTILGYVFIGSFIGVFFLICFINLSRNSRHNT